MKAFFVLALVAVVAMAAADHHEGHVDTQSEPHVDTHAVDRIPPPPSKPATDLKGSEAVYVASPYAYTAYSGAHPYAYNAYPYAYGAYPAYYYG